MGVRYTLNLDFTIYKSVLESDLGHLIQNDTLDNILKDCFLEFIGKDWSKIQAKNETAVQYVDLMFKEDMKRKCYQYLEGISNCAILWKEETIFNPTAVDFESLFRKGMKNGEASYKDSFLAIDTMKMIQVYNEGSAANILSSSFSEAVSRKDFDHAILCLEREELLKVSVAEDVLDRIGNFPAEFAMAFEQYICKRGSGYLLLKLCEKTQSISEGSDQTEIEELEQKIDSLLVATKSYDRRSPEEIAQLSASKKIHVYIQTQEDPTELYRMMERYNLLVESKMLEKFPFLHDPDIENSIFGYIVNGEDVRSLLMYLDQSVEMVVEKVFREHSLLNYEEFVTQNSSWINNNQILVSGVLYSLLEQVESKSMFLNILNHLKNISRGNTTTKSRLMLFALIAEVDEDIFPLQESWRQAALYHTLCKHCGFLRVAKVLLALTQDSLLESEFSESLINEFISRSFKQSLSKSDEDIVPCLEFLDELLNPQSVIEKLIEIDLSGFENLSGLKKMCSHFLKECDPKMKPRLQIFADKVASMQIIQNFEKESENKGFLLQFSESLKNESHLSSFLARMIAAGMHLKDVEAICTLSIAKNIEFDSILIQFVEQRIDSSVDIGLASLWDKIKDHFSSAKSDALKSSLTKYLASLEKNRCSEEISKFIYSTEKETNEKMLKRLFDRLKSGNQTLSESNDAMKQISTMDETVFVYCCILFNGIDLLDKFWNSTKFRKEYELLVYFASGLGAPSFDLDTLTLEEKWLFVLSLDACPSYPEEIQLEPLLSSLEGFSDEFGLNLVGVVFCKLLHDFKEEAVQFAQSYFDIPKSLSLLRDKKYTIKHLLNEISKLPLPQPANICFDDLSISKALSLRLNAEMRSIPSLVRTAEMFIK